MLKPLNKAKKSPQREASKPQREARGLAGARGLPGHEGRVSRPDMILVGTVIGAHSIRGALRVKSFCEKPEDITSYGPLFLEGGQKLTPQRLQQGAKGTYILTVSEITDRTAAENLGKANLYAQKANIPLAEDEVLHADIIGLPVTLHGQEIGTVEEIFYNGAQDVLDIKTPANNILIPWVEEYVKTVGDTVVLTEEADAFLAV